MPHNDPHRHHVGVGIVVDTVVGPVGVAGVELIGSDNPTNHVAALGFIELSAADPEPGDLGQHLGAVLDQVLQVAGDLVVLPDVVGDGDPDVMGPGAGIRVPAS